MFQGSLLTVGMDQETQFRFTGVERLYGLEAMERLQKAHVLVIGLGGVGSWTVESLARTGVGALTLVDFDDICVSNSNRQIHALEGNIGRLKIDALRERVLKINPQLKVNVLELAYGPETEAEIFSGKIDVVVDAIDRSYTKFKLILACKKRNIPIVITGAAGGMLDPTQVKVGDLSKVYDDNMLAILRRDLRQQADFPRKRRMNIPCVFSSEAVSYMDENGSMTLSKPESFRGPLDCATGLGTVTSVTGTFGFMLSHLAIQAVLKPKHASSHTDSQLPTEQHREQ